jgi:hypothetical protein
MPMMLLIKKFAELAKKSKIDLAEEAEDLLHRTETLTKSK